MSAMVRRLRSLTREERALALGTVLAGPALLVALRLFGLRRIHGWTGAARRHASVGEIRIAPETLARWATVARRAAVLAPLPSTCLSRALALQWWLGRRGVATQLRIGARLAGGALDAHAWLEFQGIPFTDSVATIREFARFAPAARRADV